MSQRKGSVLKLVQGSPGRRPIPVEPAVAAEIPTPPRYLSAAARREWKRTAPLLKAAGLISMADREAFARWCALTARVAEHEAQLAQESAVVVAQSGFKMPNPLIGMINAASKQLVGLSDRFLMNPRARIGAHVESKPEQDEFDRYLAAGRDKSST